MKKIIGISIFILCVVVAMFIKHSKMFREKDSVVRIAYAQYASSFFIALEKGYFEKEGIHVELISFPAPNTTTQALVKGDIDVASLPYSFLFPLQIASPDAFKIFSGIVETKEQPCSYLIVKDAIQKPEDLKGKKVVTRSGLNGKVQAMLIFKALGVDLSEVELIQVESPLTVATFAKDDISGVIDVEPSAATIQQGKLGKVLISGVRPTYLFDPYPTTATVFSAKFLEKNKDVAKKIIRANDAAIDFIRNNDKESRLIMQKYLKLDQDIALSMSPIVYQKFLEIDRDAIEREMNLEFENGILKEKVNLKNIYYQL